MSEIALQNIDRIVGEIETKTRNGKMSISKSWDYLGQFLEAHMVRGVKSPLEIGLCFFLGSVSAFQYAMGYDRCRELRKQITQVWEDDDASSTYLGRYGSLKERVLFCYLMRELTGRQNGKRSGKRSGKKNVGKNATKNVARNAR